MMVKVERIDYEESFQTMLRFTDGNKGQEIFVQVWEADGIELAIKGMSLDTVNSFYNKSGIVTIKEW
tara:strand:- start:1678 stop:1878 length:201 start_codon:yes stop_codon:yes gene_type:complete